jgi:hypothetical protein
VAGGTKLVFFRIVSDFLISNGKNWLAFEFKWLYLILNKNIDQVVPFCYRSPALVMIGTNRKVPPRPTQTGVVPSAMDDL